MKRARFRVRPRDGAEKRAKGRASETREGWTARKLELLERSGGRCEVTLDAVRCRRVAVDPCHIIPRSQGGSDALDNLYAGCRAHHRQQDAPYFKGKLLVSAGPRFRVVTAPDKWAARGGA